MLYVRTYKDYSSLQSQYPVVYGDYDITFPTPVQYVARGSALLNAGKYEEALRDYDKAMDLGGLNDASLFSNRSVAHYKMGDYWLAIMDCDKAIGIYPEDGVAYYNRGLAKFFLGDTEGAREDYDKSVQLGVNLPHYGPNWYRERQRRR
jgi:tetratricopeptide (TPR) repeat protein